MQVRDTDDMTAIPGAPHRPGPATLAPHGLMRIAWAAMGRKDVIPLYFGESDMVTPEPIRRAALDALDAGETFYPPARGLPDLRRALADDLSALYGAAVSEDRILVPGSTMLSLSIVLQTLLSDGANVVIPTPQWPNVFDAVRALRGVPREVPMTFDESGDAPRWSLDLDRLFDACDEHTAALFLPSPANPTGWIMAADEQKAALDFARARGLAVISDEVYGRLTFAHPPAPSLLTLAEPEEPVFILNGFSKCWAMTGWRLGWAVHPAGMGETLGALSAVANTGAPRFIQRAGLAALATGEEIISQVRDRCRAGRDLVSAFVARHQRLACAEPEGGFFAFVKVEGLTGSLGFAERLLAEQNVGVAPGSAFGAEFDDFIRLCIAISPEKLAEALRRLERAL